MILNNKKPIYGVVDSVEEDVRYTGEKTTTASVTVNNVDRTIKVDVNTTALLGETAASAYPGNKGANLAKEVSKFTNSIKELKDQIQETDLALRQSIAEVISDSTESDEALRAQIIAEEQRALAAEVAIRDIAQTASDKVDYITNNAVDDIAKLREEITLIEKQVYNEVDVLEDHMIEGFASLQGEIDTIVTDKIESVIDQVHKDVADQTEVLKSDVEKLQTADSQLKQDIKNLSKDIARVESGAISAIQTAVAQVDTKLAQTVATVTDYVNTSVEELHESIDSLDTSVDGRIQLAVKELDSKLDVETKRATSKEDELASRIDTSVQALEASDTQLANETSKVHAELLKVEAQIYQEIQVTSDVMWDYVTQSVDRIEDETTQLVANNKVELIELIEETDARLTKSINNSHTALTANIAEVNIRVTNINNELRSSVNRIDNDLTIAKNRFEEKDKEHDSSLKNITENYATKTYVENRFVEYSKLSKQIADAADVENDTVTIKGVVQAPVDGVVYLVKDQTAEGEDSYKQYTVIDGDLVLIGDTKINLDDYATKDYVAEQIKQIPEVDLTDYAKVEDLPDVSSFISAIPEEYVTEDELTAKGYITEHQDLTRYATKTYVQAEVAKAGTIKKQIVDSIDLENKTVVIDGETTRVKSDIIYLVLTEDGTAYNQYTLIDNELVNIGATDVDLQNYATQEYVDERVAAMSETINSNFVSLLQSIEFIDGGNAPLGI